MIFSFDKIKCKIVYFLIWMIVIMLLFSCSDKRVIEEYNRLESNKIEQTKNEKAYKYMINTDSCKVHTYDCGNSRIRNENHKLPINEKLEVILSDSKYDICGHCLAGLRAYKSLTENEISLIEDFMKLHEFVNIDFETEEFLMCIFEVADWYTDNVYTYQGAHKVKSEIDSMSKSASKKAQKIWNIKRASFNDTEYVMQSTNDDIDLKTGKYKNNDARYDCNYFANYDKKEVVDDCSKFVTAVYYHYYNKTNKITKDMDFNLLYTGSSKYNSNVSSIMQILKINKQFEFLDKNKISQLHEGYLIGREYGDVKLQAGDLIYKASIVSTNSNIIKPAHVEFYINENMTIGWGKLMGTSKTYKQFKPWDNGFESNFDWDEKQKYISVVRFNGGGKNENK